MDVHVVGDDVLARLGQLTVAARLGGHVDDDGAILHAPDHLPGNDDRRLLAGDGGGGDHHVGGRDRLGQLLGLRGLFLGRQLAGVAAGTVGGNAGIDELGTERLDLLTGCGTDVVGFDHGAQATTGGDRLQAGNAGADDQHAGRTDGAGSGGQHREELGTAGGSDQAALVAGAGALARQRIHALGARDARQQFEREGGNPAGIQGCQAFFRFKGLEQPDQNRPFGHRGDFVRRRRGHAHDQLRLAIGLPDPVDEGRSGVIGVEKMAFGAGALLHAEQGAEGGELLRGLGDQRNPGFAGGTFAGNRDGERHVVISREFLRAILPVADRCD